MGALGAISVIFASKAAVDSANALGLQKILIAFILPL
jgi:hypothetical protein